MSAFEIKRSSPRKHRSLQTPVVAALRGIAFQESAVAGIAELADGLKPLVGFLTRPVVVDGPVLADHVFPGRLELPFKAGEEASLEHAEELEVEGADYIDASITAGTALETALSFTAGKLGTQAGGQLSLYRLKEIIPDGDARKEVATALRIRVAQIDL